VEFQNAEFRRYEEHSLPRALQENTLSPRRARRDAPYLVPYIKKAEG
jgi:hypothetical protein